MRKSNLVINCPALLPYVVVFVIASFPALAAPGAPSGLTATPGDGEVVLSWVAPPDDGEGEIEAYNVYRCEGAGCEIDADADWLAWVTTGTTYTDWGTEDKPFVADVVHRYAVAAYRGEEGDWSNEVEVLTQGMPPSAPPGTPSGLTATPGDGEVVLSWVAPPDDGEGEIEAYNVYRCEGAGCEIDADADWLAWVTTGTTYTDWGTEDKPFVADVVHRYAVAAYRGEEGDWSNEVEVLTQGMLPSAPPGTPSGLTATPGDGEVVLSWVAPPDDGEGEIEAYNVYRCEGAGCEIDADADWLAWVTTGTTYTDWGTEDKPFVADVVHRYAVAAYRGEEGDWSNEVEVLTQGMPPSAPPGAPSGLTATPGDGEVALSWVAPAGEVTGWELLIRTDTDQGSWMSVTPVGEETKSYTVTGLTNGVKYTFAVRAVNRSLKGASVGRRGPATVPFSSETPSSMALLPGAPSRLTATPGDGEVALSWVAPAGEVTGWELLIRTDTDAGVWMRITPTGAETKSYTVGGLTNDVQYTFAVRAINGEIKGASAGRRGPATVPSSTSTTRAGEFIASFESGLQWYQRDVPPGLSGTTEWNSVAWRGERIQQHILVKNVPSGSRISLVSSDLTAETNDVIPAGAVSFRYPRFVAGHEEARSCSEDYQEENRTAYLSDALFSSPVQALPLNWPELVWVSVDIPVETPPGDYTGTVSISAVSGETTAAQTSLLVSIQVVPWALPEAADRQFHLDLWQFPVSVLNRYNDENPADRIEIWSEEHYALLEPTYRYLAELGQRTVTTYIKEGALGDPSMVQWTLKRDGSWEYDYSVFQEHVMRLASWGIDQQISAFSPVGWNRGDIPYWDETAQGEKTLQTDVGSSDWNTRWRHFLTDFREYLLERGWFDKTVLYLDESGEEDVNAVIDLVRTVDENWKIGAAYIGYGSDGPGEHILSELYDGSGSMELVGTVYVDTGLIAGETYRYAVDACNSSCSRPSDPVTVVTQTPALPGEPTDLTALNMGTAGNQLSWTAPEAQGSSALIDYNVYRCVDTGMSSCAPVWFDRVTSGSTYTDREVTANTNYRYTVEACNGTGCGSRPEEVMVMAADTVLETCIGADCASQPDESASSDQTAPAPVPEVPVDLAAAAASATAIQLSWTGNATNGYDVYRCAGSEVCTPTEYLDWTYADSQAAYPGQVSTFYTSCVQPRPNSFVAADATPVDMVALPWHALQRRQDGYLRWAFDNWRSSDPLDLREGAFTAGDFSLVYRSGNERDMTVVSSIRSELLRAGIEDFEKVQVLRSSLSECEANTLSGRWLSRLERTVGSFSSGALMGGRAADLIRQAHTQLDEISQQLGPNMCR